MMRKNNLKNRIAYKFRSATIAVGVVLIAAFFIYMMALQIQAMYECGWGNSVLYGKNIFWAWYFGYC